MSSMTQRRSPMSLRSMWRMFTWGTQMSTSMWVWSQSLTTLRCSLCRAPQRKQSQWRWVEKLNLRRIEKKMFCNLQHLTHEQPLNLVKKDRKRKPSSIDGNTDVVICKLCNSYVVSSMIEQHNRWAELNCIHPVWMAEIIMRVFEYTFFAVMYMATWTDLCVKTVESCSHLKGLYLATKKKNTVDQLRCFHV